MEGTDKARCLERRIEAIGISESFMIACDDRVDRGSFLIVGLDAVEINLHQLARRELS